MYDAPIDLETSGCSEEEHGLPCVPAALHRDAVNRAPQEKRQSLAYDQLTPSVYKTCTPMSLGSLHPTFPIRTDFGLELQLPKYELKDRFRFDWNVAIDGGECWTDPGAVISINRAVHLGLVELIRLRGPRMFNSTT